MYDIRIIKNDSEVSLDLQNTSFPMTFEGGSINDLQDHSASWSYTINIPRTPHNDSVLGGAGINYIYPLSPYKRIECNVYSDGMQIIRRGILVIDSTTEKYYNTQILSGNANVFETLQSESTDDWDGKTFVELPFRQALPTKEETDNNGYVFWNKIYISRLGKLLPTFGDFQQYARPYARIGSPSNTKGLLYRLLNTEGLILDTDTPSQLLDKMWLSVTRDTYVNVGETIFTGSGNAWVVTQNGYAQERGQSVIPKQNEQVSYEIRVSYTPNLPTTRIMTDEEKLLLLRTYFNVGGYIEFQARSQNGDIIKSKRISRINWDGETIHLAATFTFENEGYEYVTGYVVVRADDIQYIFLGSVWSSIYGDGFYNIRTFLTDTNDIYHGYGGTINLESSLGFDNLYDFFKLLSQLFGWIVNIKDNHIQAYTSNYIESRKQYANDWSNRLLYSDDTKKEYTFGAFSQENEITYSENSVKRERDYSIFTIDNKNLKKRDKAIEINAASHYGNIVELWDRQEKDLLKSSEYDWVGGAGGTHVIVIDNEDEGTCRAYTSAEIMENYASITRWLEKTEVLKCKMLLSAYDITTFDQYTPIFLRQYGQYFYVNKISNWEDGKESDVELLKI